ncbi:uncharacterized protein LOC129947703 [Eupeodes corollae]|uniref:uncharacterized protein LOC129947703 n=1 Tax=Eupeodes corollae TaxID=290404 RepID=UPI002492BEE8|nr:uncharacterized protein LOC129947703 [Eupeodes corollae]
MNARTMDQFKNSLDLYEQRRSNRLAAKPDVTAATIRQKPPTTKSNMKADATDAKEVRCYNCTQMGHYQSKCPYEKRPDSSCFRCWKIGHDHRSCPNPKKMLKPVKNTAAAVADATDERSHPSCREDEDLDDFRSAVDAINLSN